MTPDCSKKDQVCLDVHSRMVETMGADYDISGPGSGSHRVLLASYLSRFQYTITGDSRNPVTVPRNATGC